MKALLCHCRNFKTETKRLATLPVGIRPEVISDPILETTNVILALITVELTDDVRSVAEKLAREIRKMCNDTGHFKIVLFPFAHLSNNLADTSLTLRVLDALLATLNDLQPMRAHFGSDKKLLLDIFGHKGNIRYREF